jgi:hypothetical protein
MAIIKPNIIGGISGKIDDKIVRHRYGKYVLYSKPISYNISQSLASVQNRSKFGETVKFARLLNSIPEIVFAWKSSKIRGINPYQKIIKHNVKLTAENGICGRNIITPSGIFASPKSIILDNSRLRIQATVEKDFIYHSAVLFTFVYLYKNDKNFSIILKTGEINIISESCIEAIIMLSEDECNKLKIFDKAVLLSAFMVDKKKIFWTNTFSFELDLQSANS